VPLIIGFGNFSSFPQTKVLPNATATTDGVMSAVDKRKLDELSTSSVTMLAGKLVGFTLRTTTVGGVGPAVYVDLGSANVKNSWTLSVFAAAVTTDSGPETHYAGDSAQLVVTTNGAGVAALTGASSFGTPVDSGFAGHGKMVPTVSVVGGKVRLTFTPDGDALLPTALCVSGLVAGAR
jgi:hypothetical protein